MYTNLDDFFKIAAWYDIRNIANKFFNDDSKN